jgi:hypothetical protein
MGVQGAGRRWLRFSLRGLVVLTILIAIPLAWKVNQVSSERRSEAQLRQAGAVIERSTPWGPAWLAALVGQDYLSHVESVQMAPTTADMFPIDEFEPSSLPATTDEHLAAIASLPHVRAVTLRGGQITSEGLRQLAGLPRLTQFELDEGELDEQGWKAIAEMRGLVVLEVVTRNSRGWKAVLELEKLKLLHVVCYRGERPDLDEVESAIRARMKELVELNLTIYDAKILWDPSDGPIREGRLIGFPAR